MNHARLVLLLLWLSPPGVLADTVQVAVASNFAGAMDKIGAAYRQASGHTVSITAAGTGKLFAQITHGAPFEVFLAADRESPAKLESGGLAVPGTRFTYAVGKLVLWSAREAYVDDGGQVLRGGSFAHLAVGNPKTVPYGAAGVEVLQNLGLLKALEPRFVTGENVAQTQQFIASGNAELGFVSQSQVFRDGRLTSGSAWIIPASLYSPIRQDAVLLKTGKHNPAAVGVLAFLRGDAAKALIRSLGYGT